MLITFIVLTILLLVACVVMALKLNQDDGAWLEMRDERDKWYAAYRDALDKEVKAVESRNKLYESLREISDIACEIADPRH